MKKKGSNQQGPCSKGDKKENFHGALILRDKEQGGMAYSGSWPSMVIERDGFFFYSSFLEVRNRVVLHTKKLYDAENTL